jgi:GH25 family lysozyme M1 (1,4-beta-N-acetylmuramidase)
MMLRGIDVSTHQGTIDWDEVAGAGLSFAIIKATQGRSEATAGLRNFADSKFKRNITEAHRIGLRVGVYHYLTAQTVGEAMEEAEYFLSVIEPYKPLIDLWSVVDVESKYLPKDKTLLTQIVNTFCSRVTSAGLRPMVYTNPDYIKHRLNDISYWPLWLALWRKKTNVPTVKDYPSMKLWQWGSEAISGINGNVDANFAIVDLPAIKEEPAPAPVKKPEPKQEVTDETPSVWAADAVKWAKDKGILLGDGDGKYRPHDAMTREEACLIAQRVYDALIDDGVSGVVNKIIDALKEG